MKDGKRGNGPQREERLQIMLSPEELTVVDNFRFENRMPSRAAAVRELFRLGLTVASPSGSAGMKSSDYGVLGAHRVNHDGAKDAEAD